MALQKQENIANNGANLPSVGLVKAITSVGETKDMISLNASEVQIEISWRTKNPLQK